MGRKLLSAGFIAGMFAAASVAHGAVIAQWDFPSSATLTTASTVDPNASAGSLVKGPSTNALVFTNDFYANKPVMSISRSNDTLADIYFQVTLNANPGWELDLDSWTFDGAAGGGAAGQRTYNVKSGVEGLGFTTGTTLASGGFTVIRGTAGSTAAMQTVTADLSGAAYNHLSSLTMRVYFSTPTVSQNIDVDRLTFFGAVVPIPEPVTMSGSLALAIGTFGIRRRRCASPSSCL
jgi:hypothetical protein